VGEEPPGATKPTIGEDTTDGGHRLDGGLRRWGA